MKGIQKTQISLTSMQTDQSLPFSHAQSVILNSWYLQLWLSHRYTALFDTGFFYVFCLLSHRYRKSENHSDQLSAVLEIYFLAGSKYLPPVKVGSKTNILGSKIWWPFNSPLAICTGSCQI